MNAYMDYAYMFFAKAQLKINKHKKTKREYCNSLQLIQSQHVFIKVEQQPCVKANTQL